MLHTIFVLDAIMDFNTLDEGIDQSRSQIPDVGTFPRSFQELLQVDIDRL